MFRLLSFILLLPPCAAQWEMLSQPLETMADPLLEKAGHGMARLLSEGDGATRWQPHASPLNLYQSIDREKAMHLQEAYGLLSVVIENQSKLWGGKYIAAPDCVIKPFSIMTFSCASADDGSGNSCKGGLIYEASDGRFEMGIAFGQWPDNQGSNLWYRYGVVHGHVGKLGDVKLEQPTLTYQDKGQTQRFANYRVDVMPGLVSKCFITDLELNRRRAEHVSTTLQFRNFGQTALVLSSAGFMNGIWCKPPLPVLKPGSEAVFKACGDGYTEGQMAWSDGSTVVKLAWSQASGDHGKGAGSLTNAESEWDGIFPLPMSLRDSVLPVESRGDLRLWVMPAGLNQIVVSLHDVRFESVAQSAQENCSDIGVSTLSLSGQTQSDTLRLHFWDVVRIVAPIVFTLLACALVIMVNTSTTRFPTFASAPLLQ